MFELKASGASTFEAPPPAADDAPAARRPTPQQEAVYEAVRASGRNLAVNAVAGAGKTSTIVAATAHALGRSADVGFVAFNKSIADELRSRLPPGASAMTMHALGLRLLSRHFSGIDVEERKVSRLFLEHFPEMHEEGKGKWAGRQFPADEYRCVPEVVRACKMQLLDPSAQKRQVVAACQGMGVELPDDDADLDECLAAAHRLLEPDLDLSACDFDDMVWLPVALDLVRPQYDVLFVDEAQDLSPVQHELVCGSGSRLAIVGDPHQCQPAGTMVSVTGGGARPIEKLLPGDQVVCFDRRGGAVVGRERQGKRVESVAVRDYHGPLLTVSAAGIRTDCTPNHRWIARFAERAANVWVTYLMRLGSWFRVGWCQLFDASGNLHLGIRTRLERAECSWILGVHRSRTEASIHESVVATSFGICTMPFRPIEGANHITADSIERVFCSFDPQDMEGRARRCLASFGRAIEHPFYRTDFQQRQGRTAIFETEASNLLPGLMMVPAYTGEKEPTWVMVTISTRHFDGPVYSLKVEDYETYVADGLITHNSIYGFAGADERSFATLAARLDAAELPLSTSFRCPRSHGDLARILVPHFGTREGAPEGVVVEARREKAEEALRPGDLVVCRCNAPAVALAYRLIRADKPVLVRGRAIGEGLASLVKKLRARDCDDLVLRLDRWEERQVAKLERRRAGAGAVRRVRDQADCLRCLADGAESVDELLALVASLFADTDPAGRVVCSSVHRAKGLERDRVFVWEPGLMPIGDGVQERNLAYVAVTRAKQELWLVDDEKLRPRPAAEWLRRM